VLTADGVVSLIGCLMGNPVHQRGLHRPSRLEGDGRPHRLFGGDRVDGDRAVLVRHHRVLLSLVPVVAISPILLYIGMLIGAQAFQETPHATHRPSCWR
jgi:AGZA family xanthine/uracil permease-like MFS transporter